MKKLLKIFAIIIVVLVVGFQWLVYEGKKQREAKSAGFHLEHSVPTKSIEFSEEIFGKLLPAIERVEKFGQSQHMLISKEHLDHPLKLRQFSEKICKIEDKSHCYLLFYTSRNDFPKYPGDVSDYVNPLAFFTINKTTGMNELSYSFEDGARIDTATNDKDSLQKYFAAHNKPWQ